MASSLTYLLVVIQPRRFQSAYLWLPAESEESFVIDSGMTPLYQESFLFRIEKAEMPMGDIGRIF